MQKYFCNPCGYKYDPEKGDPEHGIAVAAARKSNAASSFRASSIIPN